jgi:hypothetical protein
VSLRDFSRPRTAPTNALPVETTRVETDRLIEQSADILRQNVSQALHSITLPQSDFDRCVDMVLSVHSDWKTMKERAFEIGRKLNDLYERDRNVYLALVNDSTVFPFDRSVATKLRTIGEVIFKERRVSIEEMPPTWNAAYEIATMDGPTLEYCRQERLLGPEAKIKALRDAKRKRKTVTPKTEADPIDRIEALKSEKAKLAQRKDALNDEIETIDRRLSEIEGELTAARDALFAPTGAQEGSEKAQDGSSGPVGEGRASEEQEAA